MQAVFEKIIEKLEIQKDYYKTIRKNTYCRRTEMDDCDSCRADHYLEARLLAIDDVIEIVKQEAADYEECYKDCGDCEAYNKEKHHCPKFCKVIKETVKEIEENHNGWISCSERLPEESGEYLTWVKYDGDRFIAIDEIDCDGIIKEWNCSTDYKIIAWQPLPQPYTKGE